MFITHHGQVLLAVASDPNVRVRAIAEAVEITERYTYRVLSDLQKAGYVRRSRRGRCNQYQVNPDLALGDPVLEEQLLRELLRLIGRSDGGELLAALASPRRSS
jgi:DNA-binding IclR family transcriptional regulator